MYQTRVKTRLAFNSAGHYTHKHNGRHVQLLCISNIPDRCRLSTASSERRTSRAPRGDRQSLTSCRRLIRISAILKWTLAGASGLAIASAMAPHVSSRRGRHDSTSASEKKQKEDPNSEVRVFFKL